MPKAISFDRFDYGLDLRKGLSTSDANRLRVLRNAHATEGKTIRKRPGLTKITTLEAGTVGLFTGLGKLNTFYGGTATVTHANTLFAPRRVPNTANQASPVTEVHYADVFNGFIYGAIQYGSGAITHHYLDDPGAWAASTAYTLGQFRIPTTANGYRYEITTAGTSAATQPTWPTTIGATVTDGTAVWTCRTFMVTDAFCPHTRQVTKITSKIWSIGVNGDTVRFSATNAPRDWTTANNAGFLPVGLQNSSSGVATALGFYTNRLVAFFSDAAQVWQVDVNPANHSFLQSVDVGTNLPYSHANMAGDVLFLSSSGVRSITRQDVTTNLIDSDIGSPIDRELLKGLAGLFGFNLTTAKAQYYRGGGQYWLYSGTRALVYTFSRTAKISAWSLYEYPFSLDYMDELNNEMYIRSGNNVYKVDRDIKTDDGVLYQVDIEMAYLDFKAPGVLKQILGMDAVVTGTCSISHRYDARNTSLKSDPPVTIIGDSRPGNTFPVELLATNLAPVISNFDNADFELHQLTYYYEPLGVM